MSLVWRFLVGSAMLSGVGCSSDASMQNSESRATAPPGDRSTEQREALADGDVTFSEYEAGLFRFADCLSSLGYPVTAIELKSDIQLYYYEVLEAAVESGAEQACYGREFEALDMAWQGNRDRPGNFDVVVIGWYRECLREVGVEMPEDLEPSEYLDAMIANGVDQLACIRTHREI
jgi:hypothetical protein